MSNRRLLDRMVTPSLMDKALRIARMEKPWPEARQLLEVALRDEIDAPTGRRKTATILGGSWLKPAPEAQSLVEWAWENAEGDLRPWHLGVLMADYTFFRDVCAHVGRDLGLAGRTDTRDIRSAMKRRWGDREVVDVSTRGSIRTLRAFGVLEGSEGDSKSESAGKIEVVGMTVPWLVHALLVARGSREIEPRDALGAPELFMFDLPPAVHNGYPNMERHVEGGGRVVLAVATRYEKRPTSAKQTTLELDIPGQFELGLSDSESGSRGLAERRLPGD